MDARGNGRHGRSAFAVLAGAALVAGSAVTPAGGQTIITGETATASSTIPGFDRGPQRAVDNSGLLDAGDNTVTTGDVRHSPDPTGTMWLSSGTGFGGVDPNPTFRVDLGAVYDVTAFRLYNYNELGNQPNGGEAYVERGISGANIVYSETGDPGSFEFLFATNFGLASGNSDYGGELFGEVNHPADFPFRARFVEFDILGNHGSNEGFFGIAEIQFDGTLVPEPAALGLVLVLPLLARRRRR